MAAPLAGPSRVPYVEVPVSHNAPSTSSSAAAARGVPPVNTNTNMNESSHGSTTQESSNPIANTNGQNGVHQSYDSDEEDSGHTRASQATYSTSDAIVHRAFRPRTGTFFKSEPPLPLYKLTLPYYVKATAIPQR